MNQKLFFAVLALTSLLAAAPVSAAEQRTGTSLDHVQTGFPLLGAHERTNCQTCHLQGIFKGTPRECVSCHIQGSRIASTFKSASHPPTAMPCVQCHTSQVSWFGARFDHIGVAPGSCATCHNGVTATGKSSRHILTTSSCDLCHRTTAWVPAGFDHTGVVPGTCETCHRVGGGATPRPGGSHPPTGSCDDCHGTTHWSFNHAGVAAGTCNTCHGVTAIGKPARHIPTTLSCDACHRVTQPFSSNIFDHRANQGVGPTGCVFCHNGNYDGARGRPNNGEHPNNDACENCHRPSSGWDDISLASRQNKFKLTPQQIQQLKKRR
jgi:hypothetical protein